MLHRNAANLWNMRGSAGWPDPVEVSGHRAVMGLTAREINHIFLFFLYYMYVKFWPCVGSVDQKPAELLENDDAQA